MVRHRSSRIVMVVTFLVMSSCNYAAEVGHWSFDEGTGSVIEDSSPFGNDGVTSDASMWVMPGYDGVGACLRFNGIYGGPHVEARVPYNSSLDFQGYISLSAWVWLEPLGGNQTLAPIVCKGDSGMTSYVMYINFMQLCFQANNWYGSSTGFDVVSGADATVSYAEWAHVEATYDMECVRLYINGELVKQEAATYPITNSSVPLCFGVDYFGFVERFKGLIDEVVVKAGTSAPQIEYIDASLDPVQVGTSVAVWASFSDADSGDTHTAQWDWGDKTSSAGDVDQTEDTVGGTHVYTVPGVYTLTLTVTDEAGASDSETYEHVVVYDPGAGFVTGGGWIDSPAGAYVSDDTLLGKASFAFVCKYQKGADVPTGNVEFQLNAGNLNFHSETYDWLVVNQGDSNAQIKGSGTINGEGSYKFMLWVGDGTPDTFRIKIWSEEGGVETTVYNNGFVRIRDLRKVSPPAAAPS
jgi:PKD repeat protein